MCGVCGAVNLHGRAESGGFEARVRNVLAALLHRGPEGHAMRGDGRAVFGATRLAIRGIAEDDLQPFLDPGSGVLVACNGEIDNHAELRRWLTRRGHGAIPASDVAVLPALYLELGDAFLERLVGAFALAVWDPRADRLLLARDRAGERPLFYAQRGAEVVFATELAALAADPRCALEPSVENLAGYLRFGLFEAPRTPFDGIEKVGPGEWVVFERRAVRRDRWWRWSIVEAPEEPPSAAAFDAVFTRAVERQSAADVEYGAFLSGGVDSSLVAAVARRLAPQRHLPAYTLRFRQKSYDEGRPAARVARLLDLEMREVWVGPDDLAGHVEALVRLVGEPLGDPAWVPTTLLARRASEDVKLCLVGEGGDELFGGYPTYIGADLARAYLRLPAAARGAIDALVRALPPSDRKVSLRWLLRRFVEGAELDGVVRHRVWVSQVPPTLLARLGVPVPTERPSERTGALLDIVQRMDFESLLAEGLLTKADRASMRWPVELRAPFLDRDVLEFAARLPRAARVRGIGTKRFLKRYASRYLPRTIVHRKKRGLSVPLAPWLRGPLHEWAAGRLGAGRLDALGVSTDGAVELLAEHRRGTADHARPLWNLLVLATWAEWLDAARQPSLGSRSMAAKATA